nr:MAG TPA: hypothetical protein [Caudoviricetes sp.]
MSDLYSRKAHFDDVKTSKDALEFHSYKYENGSVYPLAKSCFQYLQLKKARNVYDYYKEEVENKNGNNS